MSANFRIELRFDDDTLADFRSAFQRAADHWARCIVANLPEVDLGDGTRTDGVVIDVQLVRMDGPGGVLGRAGPTLLRPPTAGTAAYLPAAGEMLFEPEDLDALAHDGRLDALICHEMGHVLGIGTDVWLKKGLVDSYGTADPTFRGPNAMREYGALLRRSAFPVPLENRGGIGVANVHWRENIFGSELMSSYVIGTTFPTSRVTLASLVDIGYAVDLGRAEPYELPRQKFIDRLFRRHPQHDVTVLPSEPSMLPDEAVIAPTN